MTISTLASYLLTAMMSWAPSSTHDYTGVPRVQTDARYQAIAEDVAAVAMDPDEKPLFAGDEGRAKTALLIAAIASFESGGFRAAVDTTVPSGDHGRAVCLMQVHYPYASIVVDRRSCIRAGLQAMRDSRSMCPAGPLADGLAGYTVGHCESHERYAETRVKRAMRYWSRTPIVSETD